MILNLEKDGHVSRVLPGGRVEVANAASRSEIEHILDKGDTFELVRRLRGGHLHKAEVVDRNDPQWLALVGCTFREWGYDVRIDLRTHPLDPIPSTTSQAESVVPA